MHISKENYIKQIEDITKNKIIHSLRKCENISKEINANIMIVAPASGNSIAKISNSIADTPVTLAVKSHIKLKKPLVIFIYANDGLSYNACNIANLMNKKHIFIVPFRQENPITKPYSISSDPEYIIKTISFALNDEQVEPLLL